MRILFSTTSRSLFHLFGISVIFMFVFQLEARLISYVYLFHEGILLVESILLGGGLFLVAYLLLSQNLKKWVDRNISFFIAIAFFAQIFVFFNIGYFVLNVVMLSILFGFFFLQISQYIHLPVNHFYSVELLGSFFGVGIYALGVSFLLEEQLLIFAGIAVVAHACIVSVKNSSRFFVFGILILLLVIFVVPLVRQDLVSLINCDKKSSSYRYKAPCLDDSVGLLPTASFTHIKGRSDVYLKQEENGRRILNIRSGGYYVSEATHKNDLLRDLVVFAEPRIPDLAFKDESNILTVGVSIGDDVQVFQKYARNPSIIGLEIDKTVKQIQQDERFQDYIPDPESYTMHFIDGRRFIESSDEYYDVINVTIEVINSTLGKYVDERSSLLYTQNAIQEYIKHLSPDGYLILEQYYPKAEYKDAMVLKALNTLFASQDKNKEEFSDSILMYSWAFNPGAKAQRFAIIVYKNGVFSEEDFIQFKTWHDAMAGSSRFSMQNPNDLTVLHIPENPIIALKTYEPFFNENQRTAISEKYNTGVITDDKPFRHLITVFPFPPRYYAYFLLFSALFLVALGIEAKQTTGASRYKLLVLSALSGILTFGLQYLLFYKTAAFISTNLIFFSVFLLIPLLFSSFGGFISIYLKRHHVMILTSLFIFIALLLTVTDVFSSTIVMVFSIIAALFVFSGLLLPLVLNQTHDKKERTVLYATNLFAGGIAFLVMITLHATIGWTLSFIGVSTLMALGVALLIYPRKTT